MTIAEKLVCGLVKMGYKETESSSRKYRKFIMDGHATMWVGRHGRGDITMTLADHAEAWWTERGNIVPPRESPEWDAMYGTWIEFAFEKEEP